MKKFAIALLSGLLLFGAVCEAKYKAPEGVRSQGTKKSTYIFHNQDADGDGKLTLEEFKNQNETRDVKQENRFLKKKGLYKTPEEQFKEMDVDNDGKITPEDLAKFYDNQSKELKKR